MLKLIFYLGLTCTIVLCARRKGDAAYLDSNELYHLEWTYTDTEITFTVTAKTTGWFGLGWSPNGGMEGADIIVGWVKDGVAHIQDRYATQKGLPLLDDSQDVKLIEGSEMNGQTRIKFSRKLNTCDKDGKDNPIVTDTMRMIWAMSTNNQDPADNKNPVYHGTNRGTRSMYLLTEIPHAQDIPADAFTFDIKNDNVLIPDRRTMYWCELKRTPVLSRKHHMIKVEPLITKENLGLIHHIIVYACFDDRNREHFFEQKNTGHICYSGNMPRDILRCRAPIIAWAIGGQDIYYPPEAGYPFGDAQSPTYFIIETHYDNPQLIKGRRDSSGVRLTLTPTLRQYDAGLIEAGGIDALAVPPKQTDFITNTFCSSNCTKSSFKQDINIVGVYLHAHLAGRKIITRHFRNGKDIGVLAADHHYDFNYQQNRLLEKPVIVKPGDGLMVTCHYNTMDRQDVTYGGLASTEEMCLAFITYYPRQDISECLTVPFWAGDVTAYAGFSFGYNNKDKEGFKQVLNKIDWTDANAKTHENNYNDWPQYDKCVSQDSNINLPYGQIYTFPEESKIPAKDEDPSASCPIV